MDDIDRILMSSSKGELLDQLPEELENADKVIIILIEDKEQGEYSSVVMTLGLSNTYEAYGILEVAKQDLMEEHH